MIIEIKNRYIPYILACIFLLISIIIERETLKFMMLIILFIIYIIKKYDSKILIRFALLIIAFSAIIFVLKDEIIAGRIIIYSYYFLVIGTILQLCEYIKYMKNTNSTAIDDATFLRIEAEESHIFIFLISVSILIPFLQNRYIFLLDFIPTTNIYPISDLLYGKSLTTYGGSLSFSLISIIISIDILQKVLLFIILFCSICLMYRLMNKILSSRIIQFYASLLYMFNPYTYIRIISGQWFILFSYSILPLSLKTFIDLLEKKDRKEMIKFVLLLSIVAFSVHILIISLIVMSIIFLFWFNKHRDYRISKILIIPAILFILLNSYWLIPVLTAKNTALNNIGEKDFEAYAPKGTLFDLASMHGFWREGYLYTKDFLPGWQILYLIILSLAILGFISYYKDEKIGIYVKAFAVIGILGFILASGVNGPFGGIIRWLFENTILKGFRDSQKFVAMMVLAYSVLGGLGVNKIKSVYDNKVKAP